MPYPKITSLSRPAFEKQNEDFVLIGNSRNHPDLHLCFIADGQGGRAGGAEAAQTSCRSAMESAQKFSASELFSPSIWTEILIQADSITSTLSEGFTTLIGFVAGTESVCGASSGDSKVYFKKDRDLIELTANQAKNPPVGSGSAIFTPFSSLCDSETTLLAATDGVWKFCGFEAIESSLNGQSADPLEFLRSTISNRQGGKLPDDLSAIHVEWR